ncbi:hypothetical protein [Asticcacaulis sp.]|uniref:hypothetical protein n=1 Tax=Asticcacaulis sp. TaxID=1872648 RepID=UPI003F7B8CE5
MTFLPQEEELNLIDKDRELLFSRIRTKRDGTAHYELKHIGRTPEFRFFSGDYPPTPELWKQLKEIGIGRYAKHDIVLPDLKAFRVGNWVFDRFEFEKLILECVTEDKKGYGTQRKLPIKIVLSVSYMPVSDFEKYVRLMM